MGAIAKAQIESNEPPENGLDGLKRHWRYDLLAGFVVSLVSLPLSSGIAIASGAPPVFGIVSSIIAGLVFPFVRGSYVTISGPAAGLAPALLVTMAALGGAGDADTVGAGYPLLLVVIFAVGIAQVIMSKLGIARFAGVFPSSVVEGMLGAIGVLIMVKALPLFFGVLEPGHPHGFVEYISSIPGWFAASVREPFAIGVIGLVVMLATSTTHAKRWFLFRVIPPHIFAVLIGVIMSFAFSLGDVNPAYLIQVPANPFDQIQLPAFSLMLERSDLWKAALIGAITLTLIDGVESLATAQAIDRIDPFHRRSNPNRLLAAMGVSNILSSLVGGLTIIPGGVKSKTCIEAGGRTLWANFFNAAFLLVFLFIAPMIISLIPKATLGAILVYTGWKMIHPSIARHLARVGYEQVALYAFTIVTILLTDLLVGVIVGTVAKLALLTYYTWVVSRQDDVLESGFDLWVLLFKSPISSFEVGDDHIARITIDKPLVCFNSYMLNEKLASLDASVEAVELTIGHHVSIVDHTACDALLATAELASGRDFVVHGLDEMRKLSPHKKCMRVRDHSLWVPAT